MNSNKNGGPLFAAATHLSNHVRPIGDILTQSYNDDANVSLLFECYNPDIGTPEGEVMSLA